MPITTASEMIVVEREKKDAEQQNVRQWFYVVPLFELFFVDPFLQQLHTT